MSMSYSLTSSVFLSCVPAPMTETVTGTTTEFTTVYETVLQAACPTGQWWPTYTITETCTGDPAVWTPNTIPPGFVVSTVKCPVCEPTDVVITCPGAQPTGIVPSYVIEGSNGVTAVEITATPAPPAPALAPPMGGPTTMATAVANPPTGGEGGMDGMGDGDSGAPAASGMSEMPEMPGMPGSAGTPGRGGEAPQSAPPVNADVPGNGTMMPAPTMPVTAGAPSLKRSLVVFSGLAVVAGQFFLL
ncbi:hypothetical protein DL764_008536 [Monosporascus ibericus]|uniref:Uncharacterized protein n=1 Tax=Monosporascus ibericus TaxID=155417 RepID=A0A4Q4SXB5_9PEZI|nr:hypothetical protein DL764_008536 [Monosporascus ibericus]